MNLAQTVKRGNQGTFSSKEHHRERFHTCQAFERRVLSVLRCQRIRILGEMYVLWGGIVAVAIIIGFYITVYLSCYRGKYVKRGG